MNMKNIKSINVILLVGALSVIGITSLYAAGNSESLGFVPEAEKGTRYLLGLNEKVYMIGPDGIKRLASEADTANFLEYFSEQNKNLIADSSYTAEEPGVGKPVSEPLAEEQFEKAGEEAVSYECIFYGDELEQHDECIEIKNGVERTMTREEIVAQRLAQDPQ